MRGAIRLSLQRLVTLFALVLLAVGCGDNLAGTPDAPIDAPEPDAPELSTAKELTAFSFTDAANPALTVDVDATINGDQITVTVPHMTEVRSLVATFTTTGDHVNVGSTRQTSGTTSNDFTNPVTYRVYAEDGTRRDYTVAVTVARSSAKELVAFRFNRGPNPQLANDVVATINGSSISATVPFGTNVSALIAMWSTTGSSVNVNGVAQVRNVTPNDFTTPVTYRVVASDGTTHDYTVTVTIAANSAKQITAFSFEAADNPGVLNADVPATISGQNITATVPFGTNVSALVATFATTGTGVTVGGVAQTSGTTANNFGSPVVYRVTAADASTLDYTVTITVAQNPAKAITAFSFEATDNPGNLSADITATVDNTNHTITATVPFGTSVTALVATFTTTGMTVRVGSTPQVSGTTANNFTNPVVYTVVAADTTTQDYTVTITIAPSTAKAITAFAFTALDNPGDLTADAVGTVNETNHTIAVTVPFGTDVTGLIASFTTTGAMVRIGATQQDSGVTQNNFSSPVVYTVHAADTSTQDYTVTVTIAPGSPNKDLLTFSFGTPANPTLPTTFTGLVAPNTVVLRVPTGTNVTALIASFTHTGVSVTVNGTPQVNGVTANDFSAAVTYRVTAQDSTFQEYVVTVTPADYCGLLADPTGGTVNMTNDAFVPSTATYACNTGRVLSPLAGATRTCSAANTWSGSAPICDPAFMIAKVGDGATALSADAAQVVLEERGFSDGALARTIALPIAANGANQPLTISGSTVTEAQLSLSQNGRYVTLAGYAATPGTAGVVAATAATVPRVVGRIAADGTVETPTLITDAFSATNIRGATSIDGSEFWAIGNNSGVRYMMFGNPGPTLQITTTATASRGTHVFGGQLYTHTASTLTAIGSGAPTTAGQTGTDVATLANAGAIAMVDLSPAVVGPDTLYVAADGGATTDVLNVRKFTFDGTTWTQVATFLPPVTGTVNTNRIAAWVDGSVVRIVATTTNTSNNRILTLVDDGVNMTPTVNQLPTAGANYVFRGIARSPYTP